jgi:hypothetical protein
VIWVSTVATSRRFYYKGLTGNGPNSLNNLPNTCNEASCHNVAIVRCTSLKATA